MESAVVVERRVVVVGLVVVERRVVVVGLVVVVVRRVVVVVGSVVVVVLLFELEVESDGSTVEDVVVRRVVVVRRIVVVVVVLAAIAVARPRRNSAARLGQRWLNTNSWNSNCFGSSSPQIACSTSGSREHSKSAVSSFTPTSAGLNVRPSMAANSSSFVGPVAGSLPHAAIVSVSRLTTSTVRR